MHTGPSRRPRISRLRAWRQPPPRYHAPLTLGLRDAWAECPRVMAPHRNSLVAVLFACALGGEDRLSANERIVRRDPDDLLSLNVPQDESSVGLAEQHHSGA